MSLQEQETNVLTFSSKIEAFKNKLMLSKVQLDNINIVNPISPRTMMWMFQQSIFLQFFIKT